MTGHLFKGPSLTLLAKYVRNLAVLERSIAKGKNMFIDSKKITEKGFKLRDSAELDENLLIEDGGFFLEDVSYNLFLIKEANKIKVKGTIKTSVSLKCIRCLEYFELKVNSKFDLILFPAKLIDVTNGSLNPDEMEYIFYEGDRIDLEKILIEQINLFVPYSPVCESKCKGICPNCGLNLNKLDCKCEDSFDDINFLFNKLKR